MKPPLGIRVADEGVKAALIAGAPNVFFTTPHFDGYPVVLAWLERIPVDELAELVEGARRVASAQAAACRVRQPPRLVNV